MTPVLSRGLVNPLSRVTVATLEDIGYTVDYTAADSYDASHLDPSCVCDRRDRSLSDQTIHSGDRQTVRTLLSGARQKAVEFGKRILDSRDMGLSGRFSSKEGGTISNTISVFYRDEDGSVKDVIVSV